MVFPWNFMFWMALGITFNVVMGLGTILHQFFYKNSWVIYVGNQINAFNNWTKLPYVQTKILTISVINCLLLMYYLYSN